MKFLSLLTIALLLNTSLYAPIQSDRCCCMKHKSATKSNPSHCCSSQKEDPNICACLDHIKVVIERNRPQVSDNCYCFINENDSNQTTAILVPNVQSFIDLTSILPIFSIQEYGRFICPIQFQFSNGVDLANNLTTQLFPLRI